MNTDGRGCGSSFEQEAAEATEGGGENAECRMKKRFEQRNAETAETGAQMEWWGDGVFDPCDELT
jgi:hypothetical protein